MKDKVQHVINMIIAKCAVEYELGDVAFREGRRHHNDIHVAKSAAYEHCLSFLRTLKQDMVRYSEDLAESYRQCHDAWMTVYDVLEELDPKMSTYADTGLGCVLEAIRRMNDVKELGYSPSTLVREE